MNVSFEEMKAVIKRAMINVGLSEEDAEICALTHAESSLEGIYSHGLNRVPRFLGYVDKGWINVDAKPELLKSKGVIENYDGGMGIGIVNAKFCMNRATELASQHGIGYVSLRNTTHWMRGGTYAWDAVKKGFIGINWTNTESCMPAWGGITQSVGNNPLCIGIPDGDDSIVLDMAMSLYSYGKLQVTRLNGQALPFEGGYNVDGALTKDPAEIEASRRILPIGYWKGSGLSIALDLIASITSNGNSTSQIDKVEKGSCGGSSQVFIAIDPYVFMDEAEVKVLIQNTKKHIHSTEPTVAGKSVRYPGEGTCLTRAKNSKNGIPVDKEIWAEVVRKA